MQHPMVTENRSWCSWSFGNSVQDQRIFRTYLRILSFDVRYRYTGPSTLPGTALVLVLLGL